MGTYRLHRGWREPNGLITDHTTLVRIIKARIQRPTIPSQGLPTGSGRPRQRWATGFGVNGKMAPNPAIKR